MTRGDVQLAIALRLPYPVVATYDDRIKATHWDVLEDIKESQKGGSGG